MSDMFLNPKQPNCQLLLDVKIKIQDEKTAGENSGGIHVKRPEQTRLAVLVARLSIGALPASLEKKIPLCCTIPGEANPS